MIDPNVAKTVAELGVPTALLAILLLFAIVLTPRILTWYTGESKRRDDAIAEMQKQMVAVVANNTAVIQRLCDGQSETVTTLEAHDARAQRIEGVVTQIARVVDRTETKVDALKAQPVDPARLTRKGAS